MSTPEPAAAEGRSRPFALGGQGVKPRFGSDKAGAAKGFTLNGGLAAAPAAPASVLASPAHEAASVPARPAPPAAEATPEPALVKAPKTGAAKPAKAAPREPIERGTKILNTSLPVGLFAALDDASSAWFAANGALARRSGARKSLNTFTVAVLNLGLQAVKDASPEDVAVYFPPIKR